jgi:hypothetical protein
MDKEALYSFTLNSFLYNPEICKVAYTKTNDNSFLYDEQIVESFENSIGTPPNKQNIILFHLMGQHSMADKRYPHNTFKHFTADSVKNNQAYITDEMKEEMDGQLDSPLDMEDRSFKNLVVLINEDKIPDLISDTKFSSFFSPFNRIYKKEEEYYKKCK